MRVKLLKGTLTVLSLLCILCFPVTPVYAEPQGTDGTEMQVMEAEKLEIQLGVDWTGVEFQLKTDAGMYPGTIKVGEDGVLRTELGGSKSYVLTCMNSSTAAPEPAQASAREAEAQTETEHAEDSGQESAAGAQQEASSESQREDASVEQAGTVVGIPISHIVLFAGGMVLAIGSLIVMQVMKRRRGAEDEYEDEDEYEE